MDVVVEKESRAADTSGVGRVRRYPAVTRQAGSSGYAAANRPTVLDFVAERLHQEVPLRGVLLYGLARPSMQPGASRLSALPAEWMEAFAERVRGLGLTVKLSV